MVSPREQDDTPSTIEADAEVMTPGPPDFSDFLRALQITHVGKLIFPLGFLARRDVVAEHSRIFGLFPNKTPEDRMDLLKWAFRRMATGVRD